MTLGLSPAPQPGRSGGGGRRCHLPTTRRATGAPAGPSLPGGCVCGPRRSALPGGPVGCGSATVRAALGCRDAAPLLRWADKAPLLLHGSWASAPALLGADWMAQPAPESRPAQRRVKRGHAGRRWPGPPGRWRLVCGCAAASMRACGFGWRRRRCHQGRRRRCHHPGLSPSRRDARLEPGSAAAASFRDHSAGHRTGWAELARGVVCAGRAGPHCPAGRLGAAARAHRPAWPSHGKAIALAP